ncbi:MAG: hypothetical protein NVS3B20_05670 [Polyangiales bacterium]
MDVKFVHTPVFCYHLGCMSEGSRRHQILCAAERLLRRYGPAKTTVADVAREAEVAVGAVYLEFDSKDQIVAELSQSFYREVIAAMRAEAQRKSRPYRDRLRAVFDARTEALLQLVDRGTHACDLAHCKSAAVEGAKARYLEEERQLVADLLKEASRDGEFEVSKADVTAKTILRAYLCFSPPWIFAAPRDELEGALRAMHELALYGVARRKKR